jgi:hypothetical protein
MIIDIGKEAELQQIETNILIWIFFPGIPS